ncbi:MAG: polyhydroxyalkanoate synthesis regulator DNA-binding domain-containing protein [Bdellovibrionota bacterium]|nr:polyhydroxyalkanoate synthesis regulator DNA-binding domain-containing protein [Bdellovibrionota bacterium]
METQSTQTRIIKRYSNRKLYDTQGSCYVTLHELAQIIKEGSDVEVVEKKSNTEITYKTLMQVLHEKEKKAGSEGDTSFLNKIIRSKEGTFTGYIKELEGTSTMGDSDSNYMASSSSSESPLVQ